MSRVLHKTADPTDYRESVNTPDFPPDQWFINPDISAVAAVPQKYWRRPLTDPVTEMTAAEKSVVDANQDAARRASRRSEPVNETTSQDPEGIRLRALIELLNKRDNYLTNRVIELENVVAAMLDSDGGVANMRTDGIAQAAQPFPQTLTAAAAIHFAATATRSKADAVRDYVDDINAGNQDT